MAATTTTQFDYDAAWAQWRAEEDRRLNGHFPWTLARRVAFGRWRGAVLWLATRRWLPAEWHDRLGDALYPDDCVIQFPAARVPQEL